MPSGWIVTSRLSVGSMIDSMRIDVADFELVGVRQLFARQAIDELDLVIDAEVILGHVRQAGRADVFALGERLPGNRPPGVPVRLAAAVAHAAIDAADGRIAAIAARRRCGRPWRMDQRSRPRARLQRSARQGDSSPAKSTRFGEASGSKTRLAGGMAVSYLD